MLLSRWAAAITTAAGLAAVAVVAGAPGASAAFSCPAGDVCLFKDINYTTAQRNWVGSDSNYAGDDFNGRNQGPVANRASSVFNNGLTGGPSYVRLYTNPGYSGGVLCLRANTGFDWLGKYSYSGGSYNDNLESHLWTTGC